MIEIKISKDVVGLLHRVIIYSIIVSKEEVSVKKWHNNGFIQVKEKPGATTETRNFANGKIWNSEFDVLVGRSKVRSNPDRIKHKIESVIFWNLKRQSNKKAKKLRKKHIVFENKIKCETHCTFCIVTYKYIQ